jgi:hypothetical protein
MFGPMPERPLVAWMMGLFLPAGALLGCLLGWLVAPSPVWFLAAGFAMLIAVLAAPRLLHGSRWFH